MPDRVEEKVSWLNSQIRSRRDWLATHGTRKRPWPESDMEAKRHAWYVWDQVGTPEPRMRWEERR